MTTPFRLQHSVSDSSVASGDQTSLSTITNNEDVIKSLQQQVAILTKKQSKSVYSVKHNTPDKIKDAAVIKDLIFYISTMIFKRFKFLSNKMDLYNYKKGLQQQVSTSVEDNMLEERFGAALDLGPPEKKIPFKKIQAGFLKKL